MDIARGEATEKELDALITRRHDQRVAEEGERPAEELWKEGERRYFAAQTKEKRCDQVAWCGYLEVMYAMRSEEWRRKKAALMEATDKRKTA